LTSVYKIGDFIDLCTGPHVPSTGYAAGIKVLKHSQAYWKANAQLDSLQRIYGISFPTKKELAEYVKQ
jgi:threonyl-tRNA synthetase